MATATKTTRSAFTLIELLVVVAILTLLVALLMPFLTKAREIARRVICMQNQKSIAAAIEGFAGLHNGRGPGGGNMCQGANNTTPSDGVGWDNVMNTEWFRTGFANPAIQCIITQTNPPKKGSLTCPSFRVYGGWKGNTAVYQYNRAMEGSQGKDPTGISNVWPQTDFLAGGSGLGGLLVDPNRVNYVYQEVWQAPGYHFYVYFLGAQLEKIVNPNTVYMLMETADGGNNSSFDSGGSSDSPPVLNTCTCPWGYPEGRNAWPHTLPPDASLIQAQATAVYTYADSHVAIVNPNMMGVINRSHYVINGK
jgi:prepilin-type N-terminal cleavage/methylation domain-containing protein